MLIQIKEINQQNITDILYGKPCFYSLGCIFNEKIINYWKQNILKEKLGHYHNAPLIAKIGMAYYETINNEKLKKEYFENAKYWNDILRNACFSYISPIDYIISLFDILSIAFKSIALSIIFSDTSFISFFSFSTSHIFF